MDKEIETLLERLNARLIEVETITSHHRALISQHHSALKEVAKIMEAERNVDPPL